MLEWCFEPDDKALDCTFVGDNEFCPDAIYALMSRIAVSAFADTSRPNNYEGTYEHRLGYLRYRAQLVERYGEKAGHYLWTGSYFMGWNHHQYI